MEAFKLNSKIELIREDEEHASGLIYDISDDKLYVSIPPGDKAFKLLHEGEKIQGIVYLKEQILGFSCVVSKRIHGENPVYELDNLGEFTRIQRRNDIRVPFTKSVLYTDDKEILDIVNKEKYLDHIIPEISGELKDGMSLDISGGGIKLACNEDFKVGTNLFLVLKLGSETIGVKGRAVHKEINILPKQTKYLYGIKFSNLEERLKERIIQFVFVLMRRNRVK